MSFNVDENGDISLIQGDSGFLIVEGIATDKNYKVYFAIQDKNRNPVGNEIFVNSNNLGTVTFHFTGDFTDLLSVNKNESCAVYYYGIKICDEGSQTENTLILSKGGIGTVNTITVYPKKVEGI